MPVFREGKVLRIVETRSDIVRADVSVESGTIAAAGFPAMLGPIAEGDRVVVNTTGLDLELGTGGEGFILWNLDGEGPANATSGHIMKMRYTPWQTEVASVEEQDSAHHAALAAAESLDGLPVVCCSLHSQVAGVAAGIKSARSDARVGYVMTDGAALPLAWSNLWRHLREKGLLDVTCTAGHAFGGEIEAVNVFSGLLATRIVGQADVAIVAMGPGVVGTGSALGFTGMEQGQALDAVTALGGRSLACLRISFADERPRHRGVSHHSLTALRVAARERTTVVVPQLPAERAELVEKQLAEAGIRERHEVVTADGGAGMDLLSELGLEPTSMGRKAAEVPELFLAAAAAGSVAAATR